MIQDGSDYISWQIMIRQPDAAELRRLKTARLHRVWCIFDLTISGLCLVLSLVMIGRLCAMTFFAFYSLFFLGQTVQHYLCLKMPTMDIITHQALLKKYIAIVSILQIVYFMVSFMFWSKSDLHPLYCFTVGQLNMPLPLGILFTIHFIVTLLVYIQFLYGFITRKYYLLALGGFHVEQRYFREREENQRRLALLEPFYNDYPIFNEEVGAPRRKTYQFDDIKQDVEGEQVCAICLTRNKQGFHPIYTPCKHFFHRQCIQDWAKINSRCPQCRSDFKQLPLTDLQTEPSQKLQKQAQ